MPRNFVCSNFHDFLHSHLDLCLSQHNYLCALHQLPVEMLQPGRRNLLSSLRRRCWCCNSKLWSTAAQIVTSLLRFSAFTLLIDVAASSGRHTRQRLVPVDSHPVFTSVGSLAPILRRVTSKRLRASSSRRASLHAASAFI